MINTALSKPSYVPVSDWVTVISSCGSNHKAFLAAAIGFHETQWGRTGAGRRGYHLGVGCPSGEVCRADFQGLDRQLAWACPRIEEYFPFTEDVNLGRLLTFAVEVWKPDNPGAWARGVFRAYAGAETETVATPVGRIPLSAAILIGLVLVFAVALAVTS